MCKHSARLARGSNLIDSMQMARNLGCAVKSVDGTGEFRFSHPRMSKRITVNGRRKDAPRALTTWINALASELERTADA